MSRHPPSSTPPYTLFPYTTLFRSHQHPLHFSCFFHWACKLSDGAGSLVAENRTRRLCQSLSLLVEDICHCLWHGCRLGHCHVLSVRHELVGLFRSGRPDSRSEENTSELQ